MSIAIDGTGGNASSTHGIGSLAGTLTTTQSEDVIIACVLIYNNTSTTSTVTGGGLTWNLRQRVTGTSTGGYHLTCEEWYAIAASPLSSVTITATFSTSISNSLMYDSCNLNLFGISGANTANPFDTNASLPYGTAGVSGQAGVYSTTAPNTFAFNCTNYFSGGTEFETNTAAANWFGNYVVNSSAQTNSTNLAMTGAGASGGAGYSILIDALVPAGSTIASSITTKLPHITQTADGVIANPAVHIITTLPHITESASGWVSPRGSIITTLPHITESGHIDMVPVGQIITTLPHITETFEALSAVKVVTDVVTDLHGLSQRANVLEVEPTRISMTLPSAVTEVFVTVVAEPTHIVTTLPTMTMEWEGWVSPIGRTITTLPGFRQQIDVDEIFICDIVMDLPGIVNGNSVKAFIPALNQDYWAYWR